MSNPEHFERFRQLTPAESGLLRALLTEPFTGRDELLHQLPTAKAARWSAEDPSFNISVDNSTAPAITKYVPEPIGAYMPVAGGQYSFRLVLADGYLDYLEFINNTLNEVTELPLDLSELKLWIYEQSPWTDDTQPSPS